MRHLLIGMLIGAFTLGPVPGLANIDLAIATALKPTQQEQSVETMVAFGRKFISEARKAKRAGKFVDGGRISQARIFMVLPIVRRSVLNELGGDPTAIDWGSIDWEKVFEMIERIIMLIISLLGETEIARNGIGDGDGDGGVDLSPESEAIETWMTSIRKNLYDEFSEINYDNMTGADLSIAINDAIREGQGKGNTTFREYVNRTYSGPDSTNKLKQSMPKFIAQLAL